ncbi:hypothetical protein LWI29_038442 [Acer saccharum]|uniref:Uncharacterized protein n=1 Tax=Acer saccharum TaxID=4024 RepID=A0AA39SG57_ACESA|nr:hypothetical protein LWI29_038442 [Acer saccharum]
MGSALETLCGQAYGAKQYHMLGIYMQRAMIVLMLVSVPVAALWGCTEQIFTIFKQDPTISKHAGTYARWLVPSILPFGLLQCQLRFLQTQSNVLPLMISTAIASLVHVIACWTSIFIFELGNKGVALSIAISYWINVLILVIYIKSPACRKTWTGFSKEALENLLGFLELGIPSALMVCTRVSNELGTGRPYAACLAVRIVMFLAVTEGLLVSIVAVALRGIWGYMYTSEEKVVRYLASVMPVLAISNFMDGMQAVFSAHALQFLSTLAPQAYIAHQPNNIITHTHIYSHRTTKASLSFSFLFIFFLTHTLMNLLGTKTTIATSLFALILSLSIILFYLDKTTNSWTAFYKLLLPVLGVFSVATFLVVAARATMVTWITVLVLLAFAGNRRRVLVQQGRKITADVAMFFIKGCA